MNKKVFAIVTAAVMAVLVLTACGGGAQPEGIVIKGEDIAFSPKDVSAKAGEITITFQNTGSIEHSLIIEGLGVKLEKVQPGESASTTVQAAAGTYEMLCDVPGHKEAGMVGTLTITP